LSPTRHAWPGGFVGAVASAHPLAHRPASRGLGPGGRGSERRSWPPRRLAGHAGGPRSSGRARLRSGASHGPTAGVDRSASCACRWRVPGASGRLGDVASGARSRHAPSRARRPRPADGWRGGARRGRQHDPRRRRPGAAPGGTAASTRALAVGASDTAKPAVFGGAGAAERAQ
jgi:hypothetical protein